MAAVTESHMNGLDRELFEPDWLLTDEQRALRERLIEICEEQIRPLAAENDENLTFPRISLEALGGGRLPRPPAAQGVGRPRPEPRDVQRRHRDDRALRRRLLRDVLRHAHRRGRGAQAARDAVPDRQVPEEGQGRLHRHALVLGSRDGLALLVPDRLRRAQGRRRLRGAQEGVLDDLGRASPTSTSARRPRPTTTATTRTSRCS